MQDNQNKEIERLTFSVSEVAQSIGVSSRTVRNYIKTGGITVCRLGSRILVPADELRAFIERNKQPPKT